MKTKNILHLVTFVLTFAVSVSVAGVVKSFQGLSTGEKISNVLTQDIENGISRQQNFGRSNVYLAVKTNDYVSASESITTSDLPADFQMAWHHHMQAWRIHSNYLNENRFKAGFDAYSDSISSEQIDEINQSWWLVLQIAHSHGAEIPANAY